MIYEAYQEKVLKAADEILVLNKGKIEYFGAAKTAMKKIGNGKCVRISGGEKC